MKVIINVPGLFKSGKTYPSAKIIVADDFLESMAKGKEMRRGVIAVTVVSEGHPDKLEQSGPGQATAPEKQKNPFSMKTDELIAELKDTYGIDVDDDIKRPALMKLLSEKRKG